MAGNIQKLRIFRAAFHAVQAPCQWRLPVACKLLVKLRGLFLGNIFFGACPQRRGLVDGFPLACFDHLAGFAIFALFPFFFFHFYGQGNMVGIARNKFAQTPAVGKFQRIIAHMQGDGGAALGQGGGFHFKFAAAVACPMHAFFCAQTRAA